MTIVGDFEARFKRTYSGAWPYRVEVFNDNFPRSEIDYTRWVPLEPVFRVSNLFREVTVVVSSEGIFYSAVETEYGARAVCCDGVLARGEQGVIIADRLFPFLIEYLAGRPLSAINVNRNPQTKAFPGRAVVIDGAFSDEFWRLMSVQEMPPAIVLRVTPSWMELPLRLPGCDALPLDQTARDPAISLMGIDRAIGFQRVNRTIQYCLFEERSPVFRNGSRVFAGNRDILELGTVSSIENALLLAVDWMNGGRTGDGLPVREVIRREERRKN